MHLPVAVSLYLIVPLLCLWGTSFRRDEVNGLSQDITLSIRGVGMLLIVFVHVIQDYINLQTYFIYVSGVLGVAACFLVSGYGLHKSFVRKAHYLKGFLQTKALRMLLPYGVLHIVYLVFSLFADDTPTLSVIAGELLTLQMDGILLWYLKVQLLCYVIFYLCYRFIPGKTARMTAVFGGVILWMILAMALDFGVSRYNTCLFFPIGLLLAEYEEPVLGLLKKPGAILFNAGATVMLFAVIYLFGRFGLDLMYDWIYMLVFNAALIGMLLHIRGSKLLNAFGKYSMEIYLLHLLLLKEAPLSLFRCDDGVSYILIAALSLVTAIPLYYLCNRLMKPIRKHYACVQKGNAL